MNKTLEYYLWLSYIIEFTSDEDGFWFAEIPLLPGCMTQGATRAAALENLDEARTLWLETALSEDIEIPEPTFLKSR
jgi:antitoxin HicB